METGEHLLAATIQYGDKLLPETAASGRDVIRQQLTGARALWNQLVEAHSEQKRVRETQAETKRSFIESATQLDTWLANVQHELAECSETQPDSLDAKKEHLKTMKVGGHVHSLTSNV